MPLCGSILQTETCQIFSLAENTRRSRVWKYLSDLEFWRCLWYIRYLRYLKLFRYLKLLRYLKYLINMKSGIHQETYDIWDTWHIWDTFGMVVVSYILVIYDIRDISQMLRYLRNFIHLTFAQLRQSHSQPIPSWGLRCGEPPYDTIHPPGIVILPVSSLIISTVGTCSWLFNNLFTTCLWLAYNLFTTFS